MHGGVIRHAAALALLASANALEVGTSPPPTLKYSDFALDGKTTYCYTIKEGAAAAMYVYTQLGLEGKGDECPLQLSLEQTTTGDVAVDQRVEYKLTATVSLNDKNVFSGPALEKPVEDPNTKETVQISRASVHACSSSSVCDAFRKGNDSRTSEAESATFTDGKAMFTPTLNFSSVDTYTVFAVVVLPGPTDMDETMRFVAFTTTTVGGSKNSTGSGNLNQSDAPTVPGPSSTAPPKADSGAATAKLSGVLAAGMAVATSLLLMAC